MKILGIETSCDETAAAVVENGTNLLGSVLASQIDIHSEYGGVIPEVAARSHLEVMLPIVEKSLHKAKTIWGEIDAIAVTYGPGLIGSLLIGTLTATTLAALKHKPLIPVNHVEAHPYAAFLGGHTPQFPLLALIVSGGHTQLVLFRDHGDYTVLGRTLDDAAGEAFDKVARLIGLPYPGGPAIAQLAESGNHHAFAFPKPQLGKSSLDFSFSGLKTAVLRAAQAAVGRDFRTPSHELPALLSDQQRRDIAASFQRTVVGILAERLGTASERYHPASIIVAGGVAANQALRAELTNLPIEVLYPSPDLCTDNAAMIASLGYFRRQQAADLPTVLAPNPILSM
ncbi:MAG TPA: tRNA (adenosine(37)-N6)-threonylcarbamoyltransferase complex transferase subunit TsaD [Candidatus Saccharimonadales bacterium]|nr:tRNA (adenosine(37)-N6)-threonylcarbamoyltransferase complex transferase subunit TsaD [Candidatus Saccharimonadales bacterium]